MNSLTRAPQTSGHHKASTPPPASPTMANMGYHSFLQSSFRQCASRPYCAHWNNVVAPKKEEKRSTSRNFHTPNLFNMSISPLLHGCSFYFFGDKTPFHLCKDSDRTWYLFFSLNNLIGQTDRELLYISPPVLF